MQADFEAVEAVRRLVSSSEKIPSLQILAQLPEIQQDKFYELMNAISNAFQLLHDASVASNAHSKMMSVSHAINNLKSYSLQLDDLKSIELVDGLLYEELHTEVERIIEFVAATDADKDEGF